MARTADNRRASRQPRFFGVLVGMLLLCGVGCSDQAGDGSGTIQKGTAIAIGDGAVQGEIVGATRRFLGIPFAAPPVGALRWRPPQPPAPWSGTLQTTQFGSACPQRPSTLGTPSEN